jgi:hypothetical protein
VPIHDETFWTRLDEKRDVELGSNAGYALFDELFEHALQLTSTRERMRALERLLVMSSSMDYHQCTVIQELIQISSLPTRRRAELTLELAVQLQRSEGFTEVFWAERVAVAQDALALAQRVRDRKLVREAERIFRQVRSGYSPKREDKPLRR